MNTTQTTERDSAYLSIFITALEGGIGYWSACSRYHWTTATKEQNPLDHEDVLGFYATIHDREGEWFDELLDEVTKDEDQRSVRIDRAVIARGVGKFIKKDYRPDSYFGRAKVALQWSKWDDLDVDADIADVIVQLGIFEKEIFG
jgi:hypothetical protein